MFSLKVKNAQDAEMELTGKETVYQITKIEGLNPPKATVNISAIAGMDGGIFNSSRLNTRNLVITIRINGDVETNRLTLYKFFRAKEKVTIYFSNASRDVFIEGYVESFECGLFTRSEIAQISIICPYPYFSALDDMVTAFQTVNPLFTFPFSIASDDPVVISEVGSNTSVMIDNESETSCGVSIEASIRKVINKLEIKNITTGDGITLQKAFAIGDVIFIETTPGKKNARLVRSGVSQSLVTAITIGSVFFQLVPGDNEIAFLADNAFDALAADLTFRYRRIYEGV